jgi:hypothetical protein
LLCVLLVVQTGPLDPHPEPLGVFDRRFIPLMFMDGEHYVEIALRGYRAHGREHLWAFFPLFPHAARGLGWLTGSVPLAGLALSQAAHVLSLFYLRGIVRQQGGDEAAARRAIVLCLLYPTANYWQYFYTESLYFLLVTMCFFHALRGSWLPAGIVGALAATARPPGLMLLPALAFGIWHRAGYAFRLERKHLWLLLVLAGAAVPYVVAWDVARDPMAVLRAQTYWGRSSTFPLLTLAQAAQDVRLVPFDPSSGTALQRELDILAALLMFYVVARSLTMTDASLSAFAFLCVLVPLSSGLVESLLRFSMTVPTVYVVLSRVLDRRPRFYVALGLAAVILVISTETVSSGGPFNID